MESELTMPSWCMFPGFISFHRLVHSHSLVLPTPHAPEYGLPIFNPVSPMTVSLPLSTTHRPAGVITLPSFVQLDFKADFGNHSFRGVRLTSLWDDRYYLIIMECPTSNSGGPSNKSSVAFCNSEHSTFYFCWIVKVVKRIGVEGWKKPQEKNLRLLDSSVVYFAVGES